MDLTGPDRLIELGRLIGPNGKDPNLDLIVMGSLDPTSTLNLTITDLMHGLICHWTRQADIGLIWFISPNGP